MYDIKIDRNEEKPIYVQIRNKIIDAINTGNLKPGEKLPTIAAFSKELDVTPATVIRAFEDLTKGNYIFSQVGRGTFVCENDEKNASKPVSNDLDHKRSSIQSSNAEFAMAARKLRMGIAGSLHSLNVLLKKPDLIHFTYGVPDPDIVDPEILGRNANNALRNGEVPYHGYGDILGLPELRKYISKRFAMNGSAIDQENVLITNGSQQAASILAQYALENKYRIICETPCYMGIPNAFGAIGHWVESLPRDEHGPVPGKLERLYDGKPSMMYLCSILHNPMGTNISDERIENVKRWAEEQNSLVISDEIFRDLYFDSSSVPCMYDRFGTDRTIVIGSMSKSLMCGLRVGWIIASPDKINSLVSLKKAADLGGAPIMQGIALSILESGDYDKYIKKAAEHYKIRRDAVIGALRKHMPQEVKWTTPEGGFHMWLELPKGYSSIALFLLAIEKGVAITPGPQMDIDHRFINGFKLSYGSLPVGRIKEGIELLSDAVNTLLDTQPSDPGLTGLGDFL